MSVYQELKKIASAINIVKIAVSQNDAENFVRMMAYYDGVFSARLEAFMKTQEFDSYFKDLVNIDLSKEHLEDMKNLKNSEADLKKNHPRAYQLSLESDTDTKSIANSIKSKIEQFNKF